MNRRDCLKGLLVGTGTMLLPVSKNFAENSKVKKKPNLVYVFPDQMRRHAMGFMKQDPVLTPNLDRFAKESVNLTNACSTYPVCSPHRASLMTGQFPSTTGFYSNCHESKPDIFLKREPVCFTDVLSNAGYQTGYVGKWHLDQCPKGAGYEGQWVAPEDRHSIDFWYTWAMGSDHHFNVRYWDNETPADQSILVKDTWSPVHETDQAIKFIKDSKESEVPFAVFVSYNPPHSPYNKVTEEYYSHYEDATPEELLNRPNVKLEGKGKQCMKYVQGYMACVTGIDDQFGRILTTLKEQGLEEDTIVVFASDHGELMGSHGGMGKSQIWEESFGIPFIVRQKGRLSARNDDLLLGSEDIMPTLLGLMGLEESIPSSVEGQCLADAIESKPNAFRPEMAWYWNHWIGRGLRTHTHTANFVRRNAEGDGDFVFDNSNDPYQLRNIATDNPQLTMEFRGEVRSWLQRIGDPFKNRRGEVVMDTL